MDLYINEDGKVTCEGCRPEGAFRLRPSNIYPNSQDCHDCGQTIVQGNGTQLYEKVVA